MSESSWAVLRRRFLVQYEELGRRLTRRFGSADFAADVLQDTYLRLARGGRIDNVQDPDAYLRRMTLNIARNARRHDQRLLTPAETDEFFARAADEAPDPARVFAARQQLDLIRLALQEMPARRRNIFLAVWVDQKSHADIAQRFKLSLRYVQKESQKAREQVSRALVQKLGEIDEE